VRGIYNSNKKNKISFHPRVKREEEFANMIGVDGQ